MDKLPALGIDVGGGSAKIGLVTAQGSVLAKTTVESDPTVAGTVLLDRYLDAGRMLQHQAGVARLAGIGVGLPGLIDSDGGKTWGCNVGALDGVPIVQRLGTASGLDTKIENDATLAALGESRFGSGRGCDRFLTVTLGTGIGVGFIANGRPVHTSNGTMGDIGHVIVDATAKRSCRQGCHGCLESVASGVALAERFAELRLARPLLDERDVRTNESGLEVLFARAKTGDADCVRLVDEAARFIAAGIVTWMHIFAPARIALSGGMSAAGDVLLNRIKAIVATMALPEYLARVDIRAAALGNDAGLIGAAALCLDPSPEEPAQP